MFAGALMSFIACTNDEFPLDQETESNKTTEGVVFTAQKFLSAEKKYILIAENAMKKAAVQENRQMEFLTP